MSLSLLRRTVVALLGTAGVLATRPPRQTFATDDTIGTVIAHLSDPFEGMGAGVTTYAAIGAVPPQLALVGDTIVRGAAPAVSGLGYSIRVAKSVADGRSVVEDLTFMALGSMTSTPVAAPVPTPTPTPTPAPTPAPTPTPTPTPAPTAVSIEGTPPKTGTVGVAYAFVPIVSNSAGAKTFTLASGVLLGGLVFNTSTGAITGTPNVAGTMAGLVIRVTDPTGSANTQATNVTIAEASVAPTPLPSVSMLRRDTFPPVVYPDGDNFGYVDVGRTEFDLYATYKISDTAGEYSIGAVDQGNRFLFTFGGVNGQSLQVRRFNNGQEQLLRVASVRRIKIGEKMRLRVHRNPDDPQFVQLCVFFDAERVFEAGNITPLTTEGTNFYWYSYGTAGTSNITTSPVADPIRLDVAMPYALDDLRVRVPVNYTTLSTQPDPAGVQIRQRSLDGATLIDWEDAHLVASTGAGQVDAVATTPYTGPAGRLVYVDVRHKAVPAIFATTDVVYPEALAIGQNVAHINSCFRPQRTYTNMFQQGYWQDAAAPFNDHRTRGVGLLDEKGWPISVSNGLWFWYPLPDQLTTQTYVFKWTGGDVSWQHFNPGIGVVELGAPVRVDANTFKWTLRADRRTATGLPHCRMHFTAIDVNNPPKNMQLYLEGEDVSQRFLPSFIDFLKELPDGLLRFMDNTGVNGELSKYNRPYILANRPTQDNGSAIEDVPAEDYVELCYRSGRGLLYNVHSSYAYETGGMDWFDRELDIIYGKVPGVYSTPGFTAPGGVSALIAPEMDNEIWNSSGFGFVGSFQYLARIANTRGFVPAFNEANGGLAAGAVTMMRNKTHQILMERLQARIPDWRPRTLRVVGVRMGGDDLETLMADPGWDAVKPYIDAVFCAPYVPNDPNSGGQAANVLDKSPAGICTFLANFARTVVEPILATTAKTTLRQGFRHGIYEFNVSIPSLGLTVEQNYALQRSQEYYDLWMNVLIPMVARYGGYKHVYSDVGPILPSIDQQWSLFHISETDFNKSWEAVVDWSAAHPA